VKLLTVQEMADSPVEEDQEIAENIQNRIFYEESTHDRVVAMLRDYKDQGFGYLDACTELAHVFIRMLERYSKENADLQIRSRRRARRKQKAAELADGSAVADDNVDAEVDDIVAVQRVSSERKFDFARFAARFMTQHSINTFVSLTKYYNDLSSEQLKRAHRFFHRVAFKNELTTVLFRVDIIQLFHKMIRGPEGLDSNSPAFKEWEELVRQVFRRLVKRLQDRPGLMVEMLFSKIPATIFYLEHGYDKEVSRIPRPPAELEVKPGMEWDEQIGVAVGVLIDQNKSDAIGWVKDIITNAKDERQAWLEAEVAQKAAAREKAGLDTALTGGPPSDEGEEDGPKAPSICKLLVNLFSKEQRTADLYADVKPDNSERRVAMFKDNKLRLLMKLAGFDRLGEPEDPEASWIIPSSISASKLEETLKLISQFEFAPPIYDDEKSAQDFLRSKATAERTATKRQTAFDDDDESDGIDFGEEFEFAAGGPTARKSDVLDKLKKTRRKRNKRTASEELDDNENALETKKKREAKRLADLEKRRKIKSDVLVHESDEETDEEKDKEFFAREEEIRRHAGRTIMKALAKVKQSDIRNQVDGKKRKSSKEEKATAKSAKKRKTLDASSEDEDNAVANTNDVIDISSETSSGDDDSGDESNNGGEVTDTPISSQLQAPSPPVSTSKMGGDVSMRDAGDDSEDDGPIVRQPVRRRGGFVVQSDSDE
jgi:replication fork protection complex subunit Tof1/Swi1